MTKRKTALSSPMRAAFALALIAAPALAETPPDSACLAFAETQARLIPAAFGDPLAKGTARIRFLGHASFALETPGGQLAVTDYTGLIGNPDVVPDVVTMNIAHDTHFTDHPDPRIPLVLKGWGPLGLPAHIEETSGDLHIRNVTTDLRGPFGEGGRLDGNSIFLFEVAGLCIAHLGHLHQDLSDADYAAIGRVDVLMMPVDGGYTMSPEAMAAVVTRLKARLVLPMHWFTGEGLQAFLARMQPGFAVRFSDAPDVEVSWKTLPDRPTILVLSPALLP